MLEPMMEDPPVAIKHRRHQRVMNALWKLRRELLLGLVKISLPNRKASVDLPDRVLSHPVFCPSLSRMTSDCSNVYSCSRVS